MTVRIARCRMCRRSFKPERRSDLIGAALICLPIVAGGAAAMLQRADVVLVSAPARTAIRCARASPGSRTSPSCADAEPCAGFGTQPTKDPGCMGSRGLIVSDM
jgi:hypothetical protein